VAADACAAGATGVTTSNGDVDLVSTAGPLTLTEADGSIIRLDWGAARELSSGG